MAKFVRALFVLSICTMITVFVIDSGFFRAWLIFCLCAWILLFVADIVRIEKKRKDGR